MSTAGLMLTRLSRVLTACAVTGAFLTGTKVAAQSAAQDPKAPAQEQKELVRYVRAGEQGAKAYNLPDAQAVSILEVPASGVLAVHGERNGWLDVEAPGGFKVWVFGEFLGAGDDPGTVRVQGNDVRMRPKPSSDVDSYALNQKLGRGQKLTVIARNDESLPLASDWVQVWSPPGARAWVRATDTVALEAGASGTALWAAAVSDALTARKPAPDVINAAAPKENGAEPAAGAAAAASVAGKQDPESALAHADKLFLAEKAKDEGNAVPDYGAVRDAYQAVLDMSPKAAIAERAAARLSEVDLRAEAFRLRHEMELERERRQAEALAARNRMQEAGNRDPFYGRYDARGWLERRMEPGAKDPIWVLRWSGEDAAELVCIKARYDLSVFDGFEIGVNGRPLRDALEASAGRPMKAAQIDVERIEVLSGRTAGKR
jgi:hypothetical protein